METIIFYPFSWALVIGGILLLIGMAATNELLDYVLNNFISIVLIALLIQGIIMLISLIRAHKLHHKRQYNPLLLIPAELFAASQLYFSFFRCMKTVDSIPTSGFSLLWRIVVFFFLGCYLVCNCVITIGAFIPGLSKGGHDESIQFSCFVGVVGWVIYLIAFLLLLWAKLTS